MIYGFDIYSGSHGGERSDSTARPIDFGRVARVQLPDGSRKYRFVVIKATEGTDYGNSWFEEDWAEAKANDFVVLAYHFSRASRNTGHAEADYFMDFVGNHSGGGIRPGDGLVLDSEDDTFEKMHLEDLDLAAYHLDFFGRIERPLGFKPLLYSAPYYMLPHKVMVPQGDPVDAVHKEIAQHGLWVPQWQPLSVPTVVPYPWEFAAMRQYSDRAIIDGCPFPVLADVFYGTIDQLKAYGFGQYSGGGGGDGGVLPAGSPDIALTDKGAAQDVTAAALKIAANLNAARKAYTTRGTPLDALLATTQGDAGAIVLVSGLLP